MNLADCMQEVGCLKWTWMFTAHPTMGLTSLVDSGATYTTAPVRDSIDVSLQLSLSAVKYCRLVVQLNASSQDLKRQNISTDTTFQLIFCDTVMIKRIFKFTHTGLHPSSHNIRAFRRSIIDAVWCQMLNISRLIGTSTVAIKILPLRGR